MKGNLILPSPSSIVVFQVNFEDLFGMFGFVNFQVFSELDVEFSEHAVGDDFVFFFGQFGNVNFLSGRIKG